MKLVFFGTSEFALPALKALHQHGGYEVVSVVTRPDKPGGRGLKLLPSPVKEMAQKWGLKIFQPSRLEISPTPLGIAASYGQLIPKDVIESFKLGILNLHPSLLPKYRGPSPIQATILNGDPETGVTIIKMDEDMDHGDIVAKSKIKNQKSKLSFRELHDQLAELGAELLVRTLPKYIAGEIKPVPQEHEKATYTKIIKKPDARIDWQNPADVIVRQIRAYSVWPVAWTTLGGRPLKVHEGEPLPLDVPQKKPGQILEAKKRLTVKCGNLKRQEFGVLEIKSLQVAGGKILSAKDFLNGHPGLQDQVLS